MNEPARYHYGPRPLKGRKGMTKRSYWTKLDPTQDFQPIPGELTTEFLLKCHEQLCQMGRKLKS